ncbi:GNAT family N-acetyltransferase [Fodinicola acaciae]|uniref:GNAT family N-acetyltransferase n=1 Tax=Fodinicola acaciae TaxID=2681555 RepID=UPI0013D8767F|nr:GNAT family protein [Fodinicola acaciae]
MLAPDYPLRTKRLLLRPFEMADLDALYDITRRPEVARFEYWEPKTREETAESLRRRAGRRAFEAEGDRFGLAVVLPDSGEFVGDVSLKWASKQSRQGDLGYMVHPDHQGNGYATEAATEMLRIGFECLDLYRISAGCEPRNTGSVRVLERLGMRREGHLRRYAYVKGEWWDQFIYAILADEFTARQSPDVRTA